MNRTRTSDQLLYRIIPFNRLVQMLKANEWHFAHPSEWDDPYETLITSALSDALFAQCWCRKGVSDAMWRIYSQDKVGVRIRTTKQKLQSALFASNAFLQGDMGFRIANVKYLNELAYIRQEARIQTDMEKRPTFVRASAHLFLKRLAFEHEAETRVVVFDTRQSFESKAMKVKLDSRQLIDSVLVDPRAPEEFVEAYRHYLKVKLGYTGSVKKSSLYRTYQSRES